MKESVRVAPWSPQGAAGPRRKKNGCCHPSGDGTRNKPTSGPYLCSAPERRPHGSGGDRDRPALGPASGWRHGPQRVAAISSSSRPPPDPAVFLWPIGTLRRVAHQVRADRRRPGGSLPSLLLVPRLSHRPIPPPCRTGHREYGILSGSAPHAGPRNPSENLGLLTDS